MWSFLQFFQAGSYPGHLAPMPSRGQKARLFFWATLADVNTDFRVQVKKFFEKKKKNYILKTVYSKHSIVFLKKKIFF